MIKEWLEVAIEVWIEQTGQLKPSGQSRNSFAALESPQIGIADHVHACENQASHIRDRSLFNRISNITEQAR
jgi:hypothetical protein